MIGMVNEAGGPKVGRRLAAEKSPRKLFCFLQTPPPKLPRLPPIASGSDQPVLIFSGQAGLLRGRPVRLLHSPFRGYLRTPRLNGAIPTVGALGTGALRTGGMVLFQVGATFVVPNGQEYVPTIGAVTVPTLPGPEFP